MAAYLVILNNGQSLTILGPRGLKGKAMVAEDGSYDVGLSSAQVAIQVFSDGYCGGCSAGGGAPFFPAARKDAQAYGGYEGPVLPALGPHSERFLNSGTLFYSYFTKGNRQLIGLASYNPNGPFGLGGAFYVVTFSGPQSEKGIGRYTIAHALSTLSP